MPKRKGELAPENVAYNEGSIVRIKLKDFVTYYATEFRPGPNLNVVIGPNGTGKSTIISAICLGLAGGTSLLGRQKKIGHFVRSGAERAMIEIELQQNNGANLIVQRDFTSESKSFWKLNGKTTTEKKVAAKMKELSIQVDNLCQFLPQDKVPEFAKLNTMDLLKATEEAVGGENMKKQHDDLIGLSKDLEELKTDTDNKENHLANLRSQNELMEADVKRHEEREKQMETIKILQKKRPWMEYEEVRKIYLESKEEKKALYQAYKKLEEQNAPIVREREAATADQLKLQQNRDALKKKQKTIVGKTEKMQHAIAEKADFIEVKQDDLAEKGKRQRREESKMESYEVQLEDLEEEYARGEGDMKAIEKQITTLRRKKTDCQDKLDATSDQLKSALRENQPLQEDVKVASAKLRELENQKGRSLNSLKKIDQDTYKAVQWLRNNQDMFKATVFEPICLNIEMKDRTYSPDIEKLFKRSDDKKRRLAQYVENCIPRNDIVAFVCQNAEDQETFMRELKDKQRLRINCVVDPFPTVKDLSAIQRPLKLKDIEQFGFYDFIIDLFDAPLAIKKYLISSTNMHKVPIGTAKAKESLQAIAEKFPALSNFFADTDRVNSKKSKYGEKRATTRIASINDRVTFLHNTSNRQEEEALHTRLRELKKEMSQIEDTCRQLNAQKAIDQAEVDEAMADIKKLDDKKKRFSKITAQKRSISQKINACKSHIITIESEQEILTLEIKKANAVRTKNIIELRKTVEELTEGHRVLLEMTLEYCQATLKLEAMERALAEASAEMKQVKAQYTEKEKSTQDLKAKARCLLKTAQESTDTREGENLSPAYQAAFDMYPSTVHEIDELLEEEQAKLECGTDVDPEVIKDFERRKREISLLQHELEQKQRNLDKCLKNVEELKEKWLPNLKKLVAQISDAYAESFRNLGCVGLVDLIEHETDFSQFGIQIRVKFREAEELQPLTSHHQSGGERSVATMLYLMALQALTKVPFRVVDEINQGMDATNERRVFSQVVHCSSDKHSAQYFLVTPKLLPGLEYNDKMRVLCVFNGYHMIPSSKWNVPDIVESAKRLRMASA